MNRQGTGDNYGNYDDPNVQYNADGSVRRGGGMGSKKQSRLGKAIDGMGLGGGQGGGYNNDGGYRGDDGNVKFYIT
jgi:hypothetical protein